MILAQGKYAFAPIHNPENVLDVATGVPALCSGFLVGAVLISLQGLAYGRWSLVRMYRPQVEHSKLILFLAHLHPESNVIGTDLSAIQPTPTVPNCQFIKDDSEEEWLFNGIQFDYVHLRLVYTCFNDHKRVIKHAFDNLKPGGWIEYQDSTMEAASMDGNLEGE
jgi:SAM-dependent methyltransferase